MSTTFDPYARNVVRAVLNGHLGLLDSIEPEDEALPCGEVVGTQREGDGLVVSVRWDGSNRECTYVMSVEAAPPAEGGATGDATPGDAAPTTHTEPPTRPTGSNIACHAWDELNRAGLFTDAGDFYGGMTGRAVMDLVDVFVEQGHSGMSAAIVVDLLRRVLAFEPLSPLTDDPAEWEEVMDGLWQSRRQPRAFSQDGGKTYRLNDDRATLHTAEVSGRGCTEECNQEEQ